MTATVYRAASIFSDPISDVFSGKFRSKEGTAFREEQSGFIQSSSPDRCFSSCDSSSSCALSTSFSLDIFEPTIKDVEESSFSLSFSSSPFSSMCDELSSILKQSKASSVPFLGDKLRQHMDLSSRYRKVCSDVLSSLSKPDPYPIFDCSTSNSQTTTSCPLTPHNSDELQATWYMHFYIYKQTDLLPLVRFLRPKLASEHESQYQSRLLKEVKKQKTRFYSWKSRGMPRQLRVFACQYAKSVGIEISDYHSLVQGKKTSKGFA
ncbi:hypothetical protein ADUPG1_006693 [Aduncisulcus paluster]|uniref:Uncharacterized protein n=1 Tax=Aduncisulcus paluster TaxID=2918883 RepID=A0ABQ5KJ62_9EUKA|nr:hypothetical protein ADUPG1_006693 [Aduncisulcus paluster]|eukprot:gnl/Carplike_NY0171/722_a995_2621.p1 GENE.gnl/Carplike_NY0171/722_a995_2621~~gnl/Carplike_NY0171/722_a995_2621.p1  ORF type:complete len:264 (+),score=37.26 gnl/Carplike_NY0171/722_a995_2621:93-884(+)